MKKWAVAFFFCFLFGCASLFNPYESTFQCPPTDPGKCLPIKEAYKESLMESQNVTRSSVESFDIKSLYYQEKFKLLRELIEEPEPPIIKPPKILRVLVLSYVGEENEFYGWRYVYLMVDEPTWVIGTSKGKVK